jgi:hypothetical protein
MQRYSNHIVQMLAPIHSPLVPQSQPRIILLLIHHFTLVDALCNFCNHPSFPAEPLVNDGDFGCSYLSPLFIVHSRKKMT